MTKAYTSNLTHDQFESIEPLLPSAKPGGRPRSVCLWAVLNSIFYLIKHGCTWRDLASDFPAWQTVYTDYRTWVNDGTWDAIHDRLRAWGRVPGVGRTTGSPSEVILDSQSIATAPIAHRAVGVDAAKKTKGRKRHCMVDTLGMVMAVVITAASVTERDGENRGCKNSIRWERPWLTFIWCGWMAATADLSLSNGQWTPWAGWSK